MARPCPNAEYGCTWRGRFVAQHISECMIGRVRAQSPRNAQPSSHTVAPFVFPTTPATAPTTLPAFTFGGLVDAPAAPPSFVWQGTAAALSATPLPSLPSLDFALPTAPAQTSTGAQDGISAAFSSPAAAPAAPAALVGVTFAPPAEWIRAPTTASLALPTIGSPAAASAAAAASASSLASYLPVSVYDNRPLPPPSQSTPASRLASRLAPLRSSQLVCT